MHLSKEWSIRLFYRGSYLPKLEYSPVMANNYFNHYYNITTAFISKATNSYTRKHFAYIIIKGTDINKKYQGNENNLKESLRIFAQTVALASHR